MARPLGGRHRHADPSLATLRCVMRISAAPASASTVSAFHRTGWRHRFGGLLLTVVLLAGACSSTSAPASETVSEPAPTATPTAVPVPDPTADDVEPESSLPTIASLISEAPTVGNFDLVTITADVVADFTNPFDQREIALDATFTGPDGSTWDVPGFWDGDESWLFRFTPSVVGDWTVSAAVTDHFGSSDAASFSFSVTDSENRGWLSPGDWVDPSYSPHYLAYQDGTPWFGVGHADLGMSFDGFSGTTFKKMREMVEGGENFEMWWPQWTFNFIQNDYDNYQTAQLELIDLVVREAEANNITLAYTIWIHQLLRTNDHPWGKGLWNSNGFDKLVELEDFWNDPESRAWQENYYRYIIARWSYSPAIAMWQTVTEINGTESYENTDTWHEYLNAYFQEHDPYRHPTTGTKSGGEYWPEAYEVADISQMHVYEEFHQNPVEAAAIMAGWTSQMWDNFAQPNWIGEYGERSPKSYPEFFHNAGWASIAAGAATTPFEWNDRNAYGQFDDEQAADQARLSQFVQALPLVHWDPQQIEITTSSDRVRGWGVAGEDGGIIWVQDYFFESQVDGEDEDIVALRADTTVFSELVVTFSTLASDAVYVATPYNTWTGEYLDPVEAICDSSGVCSVTLPPFEDDLALVLIRQ